MSVSRWSLGIFLISTFFFFGVTVVRADEKMATTPFDGADLSYASLSVVARVYGLETYTIPAQGEQSIAFSVERSRALSGAYGAYLVIGDEKGNIVSQTSLGEKRFDATEKVVVAHRNFKRSGL
jgi:hypothetical protein